MHEYQRTLDGGMVKIDLGFFPDFLFYKLSKHFVYEEDFYDYTPSKNPKYREIVLFYDAKDDEGVERIIVCPITQKGCLARRLVVVENRENEQYRVITFNQAKGMGKRKINWDGDGADIVEWSTAFSDIVSMIDLPDAKEQFDIHVLSNEQSQKYFSSLF